VAPLSVDAAEVINRQPRSGRFVFPAKFKADVPWSGYDPRKRQLDKLSGVEDWVIHDIRRTARTLLAKLNIREDVAERVIAHAPPGRGWVAALHVVP
jgi:hypothetical protein